MKFFKWSYLLLLASAYAGLASAQVLPSAGSLFQQQQEQGRTQVLPNKSVEKLMPLTEPMKALGELSVTVTRFHLVGDTLLGNAELATSVNSDLNQPFYFAELQGATTAVVQVYRQAVWLAHAYLPRQEIEGGVVTIQIVEAIFGALRTEERSVPPIARPRLGPIFAAAQAAGVPLNMDRLDRALLLLEDMPGLAASGSLVQGKRERETDLLLKLDNKPVLNADIGIDNTGAPSTGRQHYSGNASLNSMFGLGDQMSTSLVHLDGSDYVRLAASVPLGFDGWRVGANGSWLLYRLIAPEFASLHAQGGSVTGGLEATYPLLRKRLRNVYLVLNYDNKRFENEANSVTTTKYRAVTMTAGLNGNLFDSIGGGGATNATLSLVHGRVDQDGSPNAGQDASNMQTSGTFSKLKYVLSRQQVISADLAFFATLSGQMADKNLGSSGKFNLGGADAVRAYPGGEGGGSAGQLLNLKLRARLAHNYSAAAFYGQGHVTVNKDNYFAGAAGVSSYSLKGAGLSFVWIPDSGQSLSQSGLAASTAIRIRESMARTRMALWCGTGSGCKRRIHFDFMEDTSSCLDTRLL